MLLLHRNCTPVYHDLHFASLPVNTLHYTPRFTPFTSLHFTSLYFTLLYFTLLYYILLYFTLFYFTLLYFTLLYFTLLHFTYHITFHTLTSPSVATSITSLTLSIYSRQSPTFCAGDRSVPQSDGRSHSQSSTSRYPFFPSCF
jgi:hypothetical protein